MIANISRPPSPFGIHRHRLLSVLQGTVCSQATIECCSEQLVFVVKYSGFDSVARPSYTASFRNCTMPRFQHPHVSIVTSVPLRRLQSGQVVIFPVMETPCGCDYIPAHNLHLVIQTRLGSAVLTACQENVYVRFARLCAKNVSIHRLITASNGIRPWVVGTNAVPLTSESDALQEQSRALLPDVDARWMRCEACAACPSDF